ncbi:hypothetical protein BCD48_35765 [Pseudofrankia sp. BMG5.36]|nr:hypothetical protein BCD48_35765 [Pseudofrankia sp. BMG5.36]
MLMGRIAGRSLKRAEHVAREILADVVERELPPGTPLPPEAVMLKEYEVSRGTFREALRILEVHGLITIKPGPSGGPRIAAVTAREFARTATFYYRAMGATFGDLVQTRLVVEPMMARLAARNCTAADATGFEDNLAMAKVAAPKESLRLAFEFHEMIGRICGNQVLAMFDRSMGEIFDMYSLNSLPERENELHLRAHGNIARAIIDGDQDRAEASMRKHLEGIVRDFEQRNGDIVDQVVDWL